MTLNYLFYSTSSTSPREIAHVNHVDTMKHIDFNKCQET